MPTILLSSASFSRLRQRSQHSVSCPHFLMRDVGPHPHTSTIHAPSPLLSPCTGLRSPPSRLSNLGCCDCPTSAVGNTDPSQAALLIPEALGQPRRETCHSRRKPELASSASEAITVASRTKTSSHDAVAQRTRANRATRANVSRRQSIVLRPSPDAR